MKNYRKNLALSTAATNSVALLSIYDYQFQPEVTKKCHIPKPMEAQLPNITNILTSRFIVNPYSRS
jgi:hypothetical protein